MCVATHSVNAKERELESNQLFDSFSKTSNDTNSTSFEISANKMSQCISFFVLNYIRICKAKLKAYLYSVYV